MRKRLRRAAALALAAAALLALSGCASSQEERRGLDGGETSVILATSGEPLRFYALSEEGCAGDDNLVLSNVYDCLTFLGDLRGRAVLHLPPAPGRQVPQRPGDDGRGREVHL